MIINGLTDNDIKRLIAVLEIRAYLIPAISTDLTTSMALDTIMYDRNRS